MGTTEIWQASQDDALAEHTGIFRVWSTTLSDPASFPFLEFFDPSYVNNYPLTQAAKDSLAAFDPVTDIPTLNCTAKGMPTIMEQPYPMEIVDQGDSILLRLEEYDTLRTIHMGEEGPGAEELSSRLGYSVGRWEGGTLVVETTKLNWLHFDTVGVPLSTEAEIVERFIPNDDGTRLDLRMTVTDPVTFTEPVELVKYWLALPGIQVQPYGCIG